MESKDKEKLECIPTGYVPSVAVAVPRGVSVQGDVCLPVRDVCLPWGCLPKGSFCPGGLCAWGICLPGGVSACQGVVDRGGSVRGVVSSF